jgi:hypothetical protein
MSSKTQRSTSETPKATKTSKTSKTGETPKAPKGKGTKPTKRDHILQVLTEATTPLTPKAIREKAGLPRGGIFAVLKRLVAEGLVTNGEGFTYRLAAKKGKGKGTALFVSEGPYAERA